jgi:NAD(P)-dependent dehydrogenase (short-subunit alcohol dehydrogenase family)
MSRSVLVTGASSGFGRNAALDLARDGWRVFAGVRDMTKGAAIAAEAESFAGSVVPLALDVTDPASLAQATSFVLEVTEWQLDALLNNAGYAVMGAFEDLSEAECRRQMETNFFGVLAVTRAVLPAMRARNAGRIVIVTSNACNSPHPMLTMYAASKWALEGWAEGLAMEVSPYGLEVVVVQPGAHRTPFAGNVVPIVPDGSAYRPWFEAAMPGISNLDRWGRDPDRARRTILAAVGAPDQPFRTALGEDSVVFAALKGVLPYEARAAILRAVAGLPAANAFLAQSPSAPEPSELATQIAGALSREPALVAELIRLIGPGPTAVH